MTLPSTDRAPSGPSTYRIKRGTKLSVRSHKLFPFFPFLQLSFFPSVHSQEIVQADRYPLKDISTSVPPLSSLDGPFQLAEYLSLKIRNDPHVVKALVEVPSGDGSVVGKPERDVWIYEHLRRIPIDLTPLLTQLLGICVRESCPQMKADEWLYLCVAHGGGGTEDCCAIDYILHTLDSTTALLNSTKFFPSRLNIPTASLSHFPSLFRRLSRIFSHAYYHHREAFSLAESETSLYARFVALCETYELVGPGLLIIPRDAVGKLGQEDEEEDEEDSEESSEEEDERAERGREVVEEKRSQSLDRELRPSVSPGQGGRMRTVLPSSNSKDPFRPGTIREERGGMTMGRGKQPRGTMLWSSDAPPVPELHPEPEQIDDAGLALARTESTETAVHVGPEDEVEEEKPVPKDEIEMLEDEGKIPVESSMAPLPQQTPDEATPEQVEEMREGEEDGMEEVKLEDEVVPEEAEASETAQVDEIPDQTAPEHIESFDDSPPTPAASTGQEVPVKNGEASGEVAKPAEAEEVDKANDEAREAI